MRGSWTLTGTRQTCTIRTVRSTLDRCTYRTLRSGVDTAACRRLCRGLVLYVCDASTRSSPPRGQWLLLARECIDEASDALADYRRFAYFRAAALDRSRGGGATGARCTGPSGSAPPPACPSEVGRPLVNRASGSTERASARCLVALEVRAPEASTYLVRKPPCRLARTYAACAQDVVSSHGGNILRQMKQQTQTT